MIKNKQKKKTYPNYIGKNTNLQRLKLKKIKFIRIKNKKKL